MPVKAPARPVVSAAVEQAVYDELRRRAAADERSMSQIVARILASALKQDGSLPA